MFGFDWRPSQTVNPISFRPSSGPSVNTSSASASLPCGPDPSCGTMVTIMARVLLRGAQAGAQAKAPSRTLALDTPDSRQAADHDGGHDPFVQPTVNPGLTAAAPARRGSGGPARQPGES